MLTPGPRAAVPVVASCGTAVSLMNTLPVPLLPRLPGLLDTSPTAASWVVTATLLGAVVSAPVSGRLGDMYGKRRVMLCCLTLMVAGSLLCAVAESVGPLIAGRALVGGAAGILPLGLGIMRDEVPPERLGSALAMMSSTVGIGGAVGFPLSAAVAEILDWRTVFWFGVAAALVNLLLVWLLVPAGQAPPGGRFDLAGATTLAVSLTCLLLAVTQGGGWGWASAPTLALGIAATSIGLGFVRYERRVPNPLVDVTGLRPVAATNLATLLVGFAMFALSLIVPALLQSPAGGGLSMVETGLSLAPAGVTMTALSLPAARVAARAGARTTLSAGAAVIGIGYAGGSLLPAGAWWVAVVSTVVGTGLALAFCAMPALIVAAVPREQTAAAQGLNALTRSVGTACSGAVMTAILVAWTAPGAAPTETGFRVAFAVAAAAAFLAAVTARWAGTHPDAARSGATRPAAG